MENDTRRYCLYSYPGKSNYGEQIGIGIVIAIEIDPKTNFIAETDSFDLDNDPHPDSIKNENCWRFRLI